MDLKNKSELTPKQIVERLDQYIIGQNKAKRSVAIALRNRFRRLKLAEDIRDEVAPKNILMIGPTGVGKTEIARRLAKLCGAPFVKVEATKYTEVGYVGRDVESMVRDLMAVGYNDIKAEMEEELKEKSERIVEDKLLELLLPGMDEEEYEYADVIDYVNDDLIDNPPDKSIVINGHELDPLDFLRIKHRKEDPEYIRYMEHKKDASTSDKFRQWLREGKLEDREVDIVVNRQAKTPSMEIIAGGSIDDLQDSMQGIINMINGRGKGGKKKTVTVKEARKILSEEVLESMIDHDKVAEVAKERVEQNGIIFIDEIDKIAVHGDNGGGHDVSREGVQRDILPIVEGSNVNTKYGVIDTTHILFIAAGAFSLCSPSDLIPELQGRFPLRVELDSLNKDDFRRILTEPKNSLLMQYTELMKTEGVTLNITEDAIDKMSSIAEEVNSSSENIGARRLHTIMEKVLTDISFEADEHNGETITVDAAYVEEKLEDITKSEDLSKYIL